MVTARALTPQRSLILIALVLTGLRLVAAGTIHLTEDEAYYRLWAEHLQLGYFDHPPMIAWWIRVGEMIAGDNPLGLRLLPTLATGLTTWMIGDLTLRLGARPQTAVRAALWYNATITVALGGMLAIPDAPASLFWTLTIWCLAWAWESGRGLWWLAAGLAAGLACLSKYSALFLAPGVLLWLFLIPRGREELRRPGPWEAALIAALLFSVNVAWNAENGWPTFIRQFGRVAPGGLHPAHMAEFVLTQFLLLNPFIAVYALRGVGLGWRTRKEPGATHLMLPIATSAPFALYLLVHSLHDRVEGHWPAPLFGAFAICAAVAAERGAELGRGRLARWITPAAGLTAAAVALIYAALPQSGPLGRSDPTLPIRGWPGLATDIERLRIAQGAAWVGTQSYGVAAQLDAERRIGAPLLEIIERDRYRKDAPVRPDFTRPGVVVDLDRRLVQADLLKCFADVRPAGILIRAGSPARGARYAAFRVSGPRLDVWNQGCAR
ncbi:hypothetical protein DJ021_00380 [Phenylobacterium hankyongense]|uniref:Glycosyltransferase RgtA/B/C/D-like domain-containing protein n=1 Tax=Phenylobacterium hankyongense TaxID=1813876 RepID=A0A328ATB2_9CAUL|nr:hypothetical protein DJ021_00380 [Phenylobacterium hankyongense]